MNHWLLLKAKTLAKSLVTSVEDLYMLAVHLALPVTLFATIALNEDILLKYVNLQGRLQLLVLFVSLSICTITAACPSGLRHASVPITINGNVGLTALIDSCSSDNFISENAFKSLRIPAYPSKKKVTMAWTSIESSISGQCNVTIEVNGRKYQKVRLDILQNLCSDVILGHDFQKQHKNVIFSCGGSKEDLIVTSHFPKPAAALEVKHIHPHSTSVAHVADVDPPALFKSVPDKVKPIATKSRFFNKDDRAFIQDEISSLLAAGLIKRSHSPWRAQVMIARD